MSKGRKLVEGISAKNLYKFLEIDDRCPFKDESCPEEVLNSGLQAPTEICRACVKLYISSQKEGVLV